MEKYKEIERSIIKKYKKNIYNRFIGAVKDYKLIEKGDKIAVCISGGKDSVLLAKLLQELSAHGDYAIDMHFIVMDPGYSAINLERIKNNSKLLGIPIEIFNADIFSYVTKVDKNPCYLCARMRRGHLYKQAQLLGCNKIALGHHFDDVIETILMGMLYGGQVQTMMPKLKSKNFDGIELIRPMYYVRERDIISWRNYNSLEFLQCACRFTEQNAAHDGAGDSKRLEVKKLISQLEKENPQVPMNIFKSIEHVNLNTVIGYYDDESEHSFLDNY